MSTERIKAVIEKLEKNIAVIMSQDTGYGEKMTSITELAEASEDFTNALGRYLRSVFNEPSDSVRAAMLFEIHGVCRLELLDGYELPGRPEDYTSPRDIAGLAELVTDGCVAVQAQVSSFAEAASRIPTSIDANLHAVKNELFSKLLTERYRFVKVPYYEEAAQVKKNAVTEAGTQPGDSEDNDYPADLYNESDLVENEEEMEGSAAFRACLLKVFPENDGVNNTFPETVNKMRGQWLSDYREKHIRLFPELQDEKISSAIKDEAVAELFEKLTAIEAEERAEISGISEKYSARAYEALAAASAGSLIKREDAPGLDTFAMCLVTFYRFSYRERMAKIEELEKTNPELAAGMRGCIFFFGDIVYLDDSSMQKVLRELDMNVIARALKGTSPEVQEMFHRNMSRRAVSLLRDDMDFMGPVPLEEVLDAQAAITDVILKLESAGYISIPAPRGSRAGL